MAKPLCSPFATDPLHINRAAGDTEEDFLAAVQQKAFEDVRKGFDNSDKANSSRILGHLSNMTSLEIPAVLNYAETAIAAYRKTNLKGANPDAPSAVMRVIYCLPSAANRRLQQFTV